MEYHLSPFSDELYQGSQSLERLCIGRLKLTAVEGALEFKVRIHIKSDSYQEQSFARMDVWVPQDLKWSHVCYIPSANMKTPLSLAYRQPNRQHRREFQADFDKLVSSAVQILF